MNLSITRATECGVPTDIAVRVMVVKGLDFRLCAPRAAGAQHNLAVALTTASFFGGGLVLAHELGHRLMGEAHWPNCNEDNLMCDSANALGNTLSDDQCSAARLTAMDIQQSFSWP